MTIQSDNWIKNQSTGRRYNHATLDGIIVASAVPLSYFRFDDVKEKVAKLKLGESIKLDEYTVIKLVTEGALITPFIDSSRSDIIFNERQIKVPSFGLSSYGYDIRLSDKFKVQTNDKLFPFPIDPANLEQTSTFIDVTTDRFILPPRSFALGVSMERLVMPSDILAICMGKSSCARYGLSAQITPIEPGFIGFITIELFNMTDYPMYLYTGQGIMQLLFYQGLTCDVTYADRNGKYQNQPPEPVAAR